MAVQKWNGLFSGLALFSFFVLFWNPGREGKLPYGQELPLVERNHFSHKNSRVKNFKNAGYDFGRRGAHRAFQAEPILLKMIFKTGLQNDKQPQSQAIRIKA